jgi:excinuclease UvrABC ATPase subunit
MRIVPTNRKARIFKSPREWPVDITCMKLDRYKTHDIEIVVDRMVIENTPDNEKRLSESINTAMHHGENVLMVLDQDSKEVRYFSRNLMCPTSGISYQNPELIYFPSQKEPVIIAKDWDGKRNKY